MSVSAGSRYYSLFEHLRRSGAGEVTLSFAAIEALLGRALPDSARAARAWWSDRDNGTQAAAWMPANYRVAALDLAGEQVTFSKHQVEYQVQRVGEIIVRPLDQSDASYSIVKGQPGDLCPPCAKQQLGSLGHWQGHGGAHFPAELLPLRLFKCCMWLWLVVPGLRDDEPQQRL